MKKEEMNDIHQFLIPKLEEKNINRENLKVDVTTSKSERKRGDVWISLESQKNRKIFEKNIIALIEAKHQNSARGDIDWRDAMRHGKKKALKQKLNYYIVTNCKSQFRFYNAYNDEEIGVDGKILTKLVPIEVLQKINSQVNEENSHVIHKTTKEIVPLHESQFRSTLKVLADIYRAAGLKKGDDRIDPTISFVVLKYISEKEKEKRHLPNEIKLWDDFIDICKKNGDIEGEKDIKSAFKTMEDQIWGEDSEYKDNIYKDFKNLISFPSKLKNDHYKKIFCELNKIYHFHGANFDIFGAIYEEFATQTKKKDFGEFYTRRHITNMATNLLLRNEIIPRDLKICDPAVGSGHFLVSALNEIIAFKNDLKVLQDRNGKRIK